MLRPILILLALLLIHPARAAEKPSFDLWLQGLRHDARAAGITSTTFDRALDGVKPIPHIIELDRSQPETTLTFAQYIERVVPQSRREAAHQHYLDNKALLDQVGRKYGVQPRFIVALWGIETDFGRTMGTYPVMAALATLAYDGRRSAFFRRELINALRIVQKDKIDPSTMLGSWAGAMGQSQFMPSSFLTYAVSYRGTGAPDIWHSKDDVFASIANYLARSGWNGNEGWGEKVRLPKGFDPTLIGREKKKTLAAWSALGVRRADGRPVATTKAEAQRSGALVQPGGDDGPSFLVYGNFDVIMRWNTSTYFAVAVGYLSDSVD